VIPPRLCFSFEFSQGAPHPHCHARSPVSFSFDFSLKKEHPWMLKLRADGRVGVHCFAFFRSGHGDFLLPFLPCLDPLGHFRGALPSIFQRVCDADPQSSHSTGIFSLSLCGADLPGRRVSFFFFNDMIHAIEGQFRVLVPPDAAFSWRSSAFTIDLLFPFGPVDLLYLQIAPRVRRTPSPARSCHVLEHSANPIAEPVVCFSTSR